MLVDIFREPLQNFYHFVSVQWRTTHISPSRISVSYRLKNDACQRRNRDQYMLFRLSKGLEDGEFDFRISHVAAAKYGIVRANNLLVGNVFRDADFIIVSDFRSHVEKADDMILRVLAKAGKGNDGSADILEVHPAKTIVVGILFPEGWSFFVKMVQSLHEVLELAVSLLVFCKVPVQADLTVPFRNLTKFASHEEEFLARMGPEKKKEKAKVGKLLPAVTWHFREQGLLAVYYLVMG